MNESTPKPKPRPKGVWPVVRRWLIAIHRDIGFVAVGLTVVYAVSGIAVNHRQHWDYNYSVDNEVTELGAPSKLLSKPAGDEGALAREHQPALVEAILTQIGRKDKPRKVFWRGSNRLSIFFSESDRDVVDYLPEKGLVEHTVSRPRFLLRAFNRLHLNERHGAWTWIADAFAALLIFLAISGILIVKGRKGFFGRGGIYVALGVIVPVIAVLLL